MSLYGMLVLRRNTGCTGWIHWIVDRSWISQNRICEELLWTAILDTGYSGNLEHSTSGGCTEDFNVTGVSNGVSTGKNCERFGNLSQYHHFRQMY